MHHPSTPSPSYSPGLYQMLLIHVRCYQISHAMLNQDLPHARHRAPPSVRRLRFVSLWPEVIRLHDMSCTEAGAAQVDLLKDTSHSNPCTMNSGRNCWSTSKACQGTAKACEASCCTSRLQGGGRPCAGADLFFRPVLPLGQMAA